MVLSLYELAWRPAAAIIRRTDPQRAHDGTVELMRGADRLAGAAQLARLANRAAFPSRPTDVGGVRLPHPLIVAAGLVKGDGYGSEADALAAVGRHRNIVPGWRVLPNLIGAVEFGSFTRQPRRGNAGRTLWRDEGSGSMQNRVGLRNPGARAAASFLRSEAARLPAIWGVSLAVSPGITDLDASAAEMDEAAVYFTSAFDGVPRGPSWYTLNLSCPNTDDDPTGNQSGALARRLSEVLVARLDVPLWVKIGPDLSDAQVTGLVRAVAESGARAVVATNTLSRPTPDGRVQAGLSGSPLRPLALRTVKRVRAAIDVADAGLDVVACGGILYGPDWMAYRAAGARAAMLYTALVFRGPLAPALILREAAKEIAHA